MIKWVEDNVSFYAIWLFYAGLTVADATTVLSQEGLTFGWGLVLFEAAVAALCLYLHKRS